MTITILYATPITDARRKIIATIISADDREREIEETRALIRRCEGVIERGAPDSWWVEDLARAKQRLDQLTRPAAPVSPAGMKEEPLQTRAKAAGLTQKRLAKILGVTETTASLQLRGKWASGTPKYVLAVLIAWELLDHDKRMRWLEELDAKR